MAEDSGAESNEARLDNDVDRSSADLVEHGSRKLRLQVQVQHLPERCEPSLPGGRCEASEDVGVLARRDARYVGGCRRSADSRGHGWKTIQRKRKSRRSQGRIRPRPRIKEKERTAKEHNVACRCFSQQKVVDEVASVPSGMTSFRLKAVAALCVVPPTTGRWNAQRLRDKAKAKKEKEHRRSQMRTESSHDVPRAGIGRRIFGRSFCEPGDRQCRSKEAGIVLPKGRRARREAGRDQYAQSVRSANVPRGSKGEQRKNNTRYLLDSGASQHVEWLHEGIDKTTACCSPLEI